VTSCEVNLLIQKTMLGLCNFIGYLKSLDLDEQDLMDTYPNSKLLISELQTEQLP
jgi:hypothetical protein